MPYRDQHSTKYHFTATSVKSIEIFERCHVKNIMLTYPHVTKLLRNESGVRDNKGSLNWLRDKFDSIMIRGKPNVDFDEYSEFLLKECENYSIASQLDVIGDQIETCNIYLRHLDNGTDFVMPILTGDWDIAYNIMEKHLMIDYVGLGSKHPYDFPDWGNMVSMLPYKYKYHGFFRLDSNILEQGLLYSVDSTTWSYVTRSRYTNARVRGVDLPLSFGRDMSSNRNEIQYAYNILKDDFDICEVTLDDVFDDIPIIKEMLGIIMYYRPAFRDIGRRAFDENFYY